MKPKIISIVIAVPKRHEDERYVECGFLSREKAIVWAREHTDKEAIVRYYYATEVEVLDWEVEE